MKPFQLCSITQIRSYSLYLAILFDNIKIIRIMTKEGNKNLKLLLTKSIQNNEYEVALRQGLLNYQLKPYNIIMLSPDKILDIYNQIQLKFHENEIGEESDGWYENQLRIFVWLLINYAHLNSKPLSDMNNNDWQYFRSIFHNKHPDTFEFQSLCLARKRKSIRWNTEQIDMLVMIMNEKQEKNKWNQIAKKIFVNSNKKYFRTPKQCRQQWINHLDPSKSRSKWTALEDYEMLNAVKTFGKKWSKVAKYLGSSRTQHMVKNRFKSLLKNQLKRLDYEQNQEHVLTKIRQRLESSVIIKKYNKKNKKLLQTNNQAGVSCVDRNIHSTTQIVQKKSYTVQDRGSIKLPQQFELVPLNTMTQLELGNKIDTADNIAIKKQEEIEYQELSIQQQQQQDWCWGDEPEIREIGIQQLLYHKQQDIIIDKKSEVSFFFME